MIRLREYSTPRSKELSIIIVSWNCRELLGNCLRSVRESDFPAEQLETFVIDNASADGTARMVAECYPEVKLIANDDNKGFSRANNQGIARSSGRKVLLLNPDTVLSPTALRRMADELDRDPTIGMIGPRLVSPDGAYQRACARSLPSLATSLAHLLAYDRVAEAQGWPAPGCYPDDRQDKSVGAISGACMMLPFEVLLAIGDLDAELPMSGEDIDLCKRVRDYGKRIVALGHPDVMHVHGASRAFAVGRTSIDGYRAIHAYFMKHGEHARATGYRWMVAVTMLMRVPVWKVLGRLDRARTAVLAEKAAASVKLFRWAVGRAGTS